MLMSSEQQTEEAANRENTLVAMLSAAMGTSSVKYVLFGQTVSKQRSRRFCVRMAILKAEAKFLINLLQCKLRELGHGEWLYFTFKGSMFCFECKIFREGKNKKSAFVSRGYSDWKHASEHRLEGSATCDSTAAG
ncbi:hypothetical protein GOODEAATRI_025654, partial [Goodea atripinnis]